MAVDLSFAGIPLDGMLGRVNHRASLHVMCGAGSIGPSRVISIGIGCRGLSSIVTSLLRGAGTAFAMGGSCLILCSSGNAGTMGRRIRRGGHVVGKLISSGCKRPLVKMDMLIGKATAKAVASVSNGCSVRIPSSGTMLRFDCVNCRGTMLPVTNVDSFGIILGRSARILGRIIIATVKVAHRTGALACTTRAVGGSRIAHVGRAGFVGSLRKGDTKLAVAPGGTNTNNKTSGVMLHNSASVLKAGRPLVIVSNIPVRSNVKSRIASKVTCNNKHDNSSLLSAVGPRSVRGVAVLGKPGTTTLCNDTTGGNMVIVAAGSNTSNAMGMSISDDASIRAVTVCPRARRLFNVDSGGR